MTISLGLLTTILGALGFELWGVVRNSQNTGHGMETITEYVRWLVRRSYVAKVGVGLFCISLFFHFLYGGPLLP
jgi:hypothetical protein